MEATKLKAQEQENTRVRVRRQNREETADKIQTNSFFLQQNFSYKHPILHY